MIHYLQSPATRKNIIIAWSIAFFMTLGVLIISGQVYGEAQSRDLLTSVQQGSYYYGSAIVGSSATILALMLTLLSFIKNKSKPTRETFIRLHAVTSFCVYAFIGGIILLLFISFPSEVFSDVPNYSFQYAFYGVCIWNGMLAGNMISTILILKETTRGIIGDISPDFTKEGKEVEKSQ